MNFGGAIRVNKFAVLIIVSILFLLFLYNYSWNTVDDVEVNASWRKAPLNSDTNIISLKKILSAALDVAQRGGDEVVQVRKGISEGQIGEQSKGKTKEGANDPVTEGDFRSHRVMYYGMRKAFPAIKVISEEHTDNKDVGDTKVPNIHNEDVERILFTDEIFEADDVAVWVDPLDATQEYTENLLQYVTTMICVTVRGLPIVGVIHRPFSKETYWGAVGHGNSQNLEQLAKKGRSRVGLEEDKYRIMVSRSHTGKAQNYTSQVLGNDNPFEIIQAAGAGYKVLEVIGGSADVYLHVTLIKKWDLCAGNALLASLGGTMSTLGGDSLDYSSYTNPINTQGILAYLNPSPLLDKLKQIKLVD